MKYTDSNLEFMCGECDAYSACGLEDMKNHVKETHDNYNTKEIEEYVRKWADDAYEAYEEYFSNYYDQRSVDRFIENDIKASKELSHE